MSNTNTDKVLPLSLSSLSGLLGINASEFETLFSENAEGQKVPVKQGLIDNFFKDKFTTKLQAVADESKDADKDGIRQRARKEVMEEIETAAKAEGIDMQWGKDKFSKIKAHYAELNKNLDPDDVKNSEVFAQAMQAKNKEIDDLKAEHETAMKGQHRKRLRNRLIDHYYASWSKEDSPLALPKEPAIAKNLIGMLVDNELFKEDGRIDFSDESETGFSIFDAKNKVKKDDKFNALDADSYAFGIAKSRYFTQKAGPDITAPDPSKDQKDKVTLKDSEGKEVHHDVPVFETEDQLTEWMSKPETMKLAPEIVDAANKNFYNSKT